MMDRGPLLLALNESTTLQLMGKSLRGAGYEFIPVRDVEGLNKSLAESSPALVLIGETFDGQSGIRLSEEMLDRFPTLPILLYAKRDGNGLAGEVLKAGLSGYIHPPLRPDELLQAVNRSLSRARRLGDWLRQEVKLTTSTLEERTRLSESERARYESIFSNIQDGVIVLDFHDRILFLNQAARHAFGIGSQDVTGRELVEVISHPDVRSLLARASVEPLKYHEIKLDTDQVLNAQATPIPGIGSAITMQDISYLKEVDRLKNDFVQGISHDLRSPLTALIGYADLIERVGPLTEQQNEFMQRMKASMQQITILVTDLLDLGRLETDFETRRDFVHMPDVLKYTLDTFERQARDKNIQLTSALGADIPPVRASSIRIRQMLENLVGNAIKYTPEQGSVHVSIAARDRQIILEVKDSGLGIPQNEQSRVFEKYYRASNAPSAAQGTGLGLAIVKSIVENYHGRIWVESTLGQGSSFFVVLPAHDQII